MNYVQYIGNHASPIRIQVAAQDIGAAAEFVVPEVLISQVLQKFFGKQPDGWLNTSLAHFLSIPFIGGAQPYGDDHAKMAEPYANQIFSGMSGLPGMTVGYYLAGVFMGEDLLRWPGVGIRDAMIIMIGKMITRPIVTSIGNLVGQDNAIRTAYDLMQQRFDLQSKNSNFKFEMGG